MSRKSFLESGEASPGVTFFRVFRGDTPEIKGFETFFTSVKNELDGQNAGGVKLFKIFVLSALDVVTGGFIVKNQTSSNDFGGFLV